MKALHVLLALPLLAFVACGNGEEPGKNGKQPENGNPTSDHGTKKNLGEVTVAGAAFGVFLLGDLQPGKEGAFEVHPRASTAGLNVYLWVEDKAGTQLSPPAKGSPEGDALHFHCTPRAGSKPFRVILRVRKEGTDERGGLPLSGHGHEHVEGPHSGVPATFSGEGVSGHLELKLHDDKGDLELWLCEDEKYTRPFDLPLDATIEIEFIDVQGKRVTLRVRNQDRNEDEDDKPNVRDGKTNYFIFPSQGGEDASWLMGKKFQSIVIVRFERDGKKLVSEEFVLKPHVH